MGALTLINATSGAQAAPAEFRILQGQYQIARVGVAPGGQASVPVDEKAYVVKAMTVMGAFTLTSNTITFEHDSADFRAEVLEEDGFYDFQLVQSPATQLSSIVFENTWRNPVQFELSRPGTPVHVLVVVDEHNTASVSTAQQWQVYAIVNGITTSTVTINNPNATITAVAENRDSEEGYELVVS
jgi:hypothetical protein